MTEQRTENPFAIQTPEDIEAVDAQQLFVDVFTDFHKIREEGHSILNGPRGSGKSMIFRYLEADCQQLHYQCPLEDLPFFGVLVSIKNTNPNWAELERLEDSGVAAILNEHCLTIYVVAKLFAGLAKSGIIDSPDNRDSLQTFAINVFENSLTRSGWEGKITIEKNASVSEIIQSMQAVCDELYHILIQYVRRLTVTQSSYIPYSGALCGYLDFAIPLIRKLTSLPFMPSGPVYLMIDDADYLNKVQTTILNTWVSSRTSKIVSVKISTQYKYKTYKTIGGLLIDSPHDFSEVNIADIYTSSRGRYKQRVSEIVEKRLTRAGINKNPYDFFPVDKNQERKIREIEKSLEAQWEESGRGYRPRDDALRYARPNYIAQLKGTRKAGSTYRYAGFDQLIHVSSGVVRYFLEAASMMYAREKAKEEDAKTVESISSYIQHDVVSKFAEDLMVTEFDKIVRDNTTTNDEGSGEDFNLKRRLHNLITALGGYFHLKLISDDAERRVFSVALSDEASSELLNVFRLGVELGYFHQTTIGNKEGTGRVPLYVLTRRLAPFFRLDPTSFAGYVFMTSDALWSATSNPKAFLNRVKSNKLKGMEIRQLKLFE